MLNPLCVLRPHQLYVLRLHVQRMFMVRNDELLKRSLSLSLHRHLLMGLPPLKSWKPSGVASPLLRASDKTLADIFESVIGALWVITRDHAAPHRFLAGIIAVPITQPINPSFYKSRDFSISRLAHIIYRALARPG